MPGSQFTGPVEIFNGVTNKRTATPEYYFGARGLDKDGRAHVYIQASGAIPTGSPVQLHSSFVQASGVNPYGFAQASAGAGGFIGVAEDAFLATQCGFIVETGPCVALVPSGTAVNASLTAGNGALSATLTNAVKFALAAEASPVLSGTTQLKQVILL